MIRCFEICGKKNSFDRTQKTQIIHFPPLAGMTAGEAPHTTEKFNPSLLPPQIQPLPAQQPPHTPSASSVSETGTSLAPFTPPPFQHHAPPSTRKPDSG